MSRPSPLPGVLAGLGWFAAAVVLMPLLVPAIPLYRTVVAGVAVVLFAAAFVSPRGAFVLATAAVSLSGASALAFGRSEPAVVAPVLAAAYFAGSALRNIYELDDASSSPLLPVLRAWVVACAASALSSFVALRTGYLLLRGVPPPRVVNVLSEDASQAWLGVVAVLASLAVAVGFHRAASVLSQDRAGRRAVDVALVLSAVLAGGVALAQKLDLLPLFRAARWREWGRAQATFTDPSSAGVVVALLIAPLLARAAAGPVFLRISAAAGALFLLAILADAGSRAGFLGTLTATALLVLWALTRLAAGARPGVRRRVASMVGAFAILWALGLAAVLAWPGKGAVKSALLARLEAPFRKEETPSERASERLLLYGGAFALFRERPVTGTGLGLFRAEFPNAAAELLFRPVTTSDNPPSLYLGSLAETGLAGTAILALLLLGAVRGLSRALSVSEDEPEEALRAAGAGAATVGLLVVFLFGSHLVYPEVALLVGLLLARLPLRPEGRTSRVLHAAVPVVLAGALVLLLGGVVIRAYETSTAEAAFLRSPSAGLFPVEREPLGRAFRWTSSAAAVRVGFPAPGETGAGRRIGPANLVWPMKSARPDGAPTAVDVFWNDVSRGRVSLPNGRWVDLLLPVDGPGVVRLAVADTFRPRGADRRLLGIEVAPDPAIVPRPRREP